VWDPANVSPIVAYLASAETDLTGRTVFVQGGSIRLLEGWRFAGGIEREARWSIDDLVEEFPTLETNRP